MLAMLAIVVPPQQLAGLRQCSTENLSDLKVHIMVGDESGIVSCKPPGESSYLHVVLR